MTTECLAGVGKLMGCEGQGLTEKLMSQAIAMSRADCWGALVSTALAVTGESAENTSLDCSCSVTTLTEAGGDDSTECF